MKPTLAIITIGAVPVSEVLPLLTDHISEAQIKLVSLLGALSREETMEVYGALHEEEQLTAPLSDNLMINISKHKVELALQGIIDVLDNQGFDIILLMSMSTVRFSNLTARKSMLLEPERMIPPLVASIINGRQVGIIIPVPEMLKFQHQKWQLLDNEPLYGLVNPMDATDQELIRAGQKLLEEGAEVLVFDSLGYHQKHRDLLQKSLPAPVLLSNVLIARLASELLA